MKRFILGLLLIAFSGVAYAGAGSDQVVNTLYAQMGFNDADQRLEFVSPQNLGLQAHSTSLDSMSIATIGESGGYLVFSSPVEFASNVQLDFLTYFGDHTSGNFGSLLYDPSEQSYSFFATSGGSNVPARIDIGNILATSGYVSAGTFELNSRPFAVQSAPTLGTGWGTSPSIPKSNGTLVFEINVGTSMSGINTGNITMPSSIATNGWYCNFNDVSTPADNTYQSGLGTTTNVPVATSAANWTASDKILANCHAY